jgi:hypothetical protein
VTVIDSDDLDDLPEASTHRRGVPHGRHPHALAARGQQALAALLPGLTQDVVDEATPDGDMLTEPAPPSAAIDWGGARTGPLLLHRAAPLGSACAGPSVGPAQPCACGLEHQFGGPAHHAQPSGRTRTETHRSITLNTEREGHAR